MIDSEVGDMCVGDSSIKGPRLEFALAFMYDSDDDFREAMDKLDPELARLHERGQVGPLLAARLMALASGQQEQQEEQPQQQQQEQQPAVER